MAEEKEFTLSELGEFNGRNGKQTYIAFKGRVYDVSDSPMWIDGDHMASHEAGKDLTSEIEIAPHGEEMLQKAKQVGKLV